MAEFASSVPVEPAVAPLEMKCNTCKCCFANSTEIKDHYRSDWHVLNSKRRSNQLAPVRLEDFNILVKKGGHKAAKPVFPGKATYVPPPAKLDPRVIALALKTGASNKATAPSPVAEGETEGVEGSVDAESTVDEKEQIPPKLGTNISIFDDKEFETMDECLSYMALKFGFFIPDVECLKDMNGLLAYLGEKVKLGGYCLYCQRKFNTFHACQNHMISKSHCKLAYVDEVDLGEFEDFYDFSSTFEDVQLDEDGNEIDTPDMEISNIGELVLASGRTLGHRDFRKYYKQFYKAEEERPSVLAQQREELLRLGYQFGGNKMMQSRADVDDLSDTQVMTMLVKVQKDIRRGQMVEQRGQMRRFNIDQRREYASTKDKLRSSENTTAKIRDYHGLL